MQTSAIALSAFNGTSHARHLGVIVFFASSLKRRLLASCVFLQTNMLHGRQEALTSELACFFDTFPVCSHRVSWLLWLTFPHQMSLPITRAHRDSWLLHQAPLSNTLRFAAPRPQPLAIGPAGQSSHLGSKTLLQNKQSCDATQRLQQMLSIHIHCIC